MEEPGAQGERGGRPLVWCDDCGFEWHGRISAEGLRVIGSCPRCQGHLEFRDDSSSTAPATEKPGGGEQEELQPWQVLGTPSTWAR